MAGLCEGYQEADTSLADVVRGFVPTHRFAHVSFDSYQPDPRYPSQAAARARLRAFANLLKAEAEPPRGMLARLRRPAPPSGPRGLYLDGGFGVGKTHLLAATYHAAPVPRAYLSFAELAYTVSRLGLKEAETEFSRLHLLCVDEFELDDVAQTRMAVSLLRGMFGQRGGRTRVVATSNTLPTDLGQGRFAAEAFRREIGEIASHFEVVTVDGEDYRHRPRWEGTPAGEVLSAAELRAAWETDPSPRPVYTTWPDLAECLASLHPVHYARLVERCDALYVEGLPTIHDQAVALRLVHLVDKLYDQETRLALSLEGEIGLPEVFSPEYRDRGYAKKYRRCLSRLHELLEESAAARGQSAPRGATPAR